MIYQTLNYKKTGNIIVININISAGPQIKMIQLADELAELCSKIAWDEETRVIILTGEGEKSFSMDIDLIGKVSEVNEERETKFWSLTESIAKLDQPIIAVMDGDVIGVGLELALACDIRIASEKSLFGLTHIKESLIPWDGGTQRLSRLVGRGKALEMILTGGLIDAQEAYRIGLVNKVVSSGELMNIAIEMAKEVASKGPISLRYVKEAIHKGMDLTLGQGLRMEADLYFLLQTTKDRTEGINAFREKRAPKFEGK